MRELKQSESTGDSCEFWVRPIKSGGCSQFRLNVTVDRHLSAETPKFVGIALTEQDSGEHLPLIAEVDPHNRRAGYVEHDCIYEEIRLKWCGVEPRTVVMLAAHDIRCLGDLKLYKEKEICAKLLPAGLRDAEAISTAVGQYLIMRTHLKAIDVTHNPCDNDAELATAAELGAALAA